MASFRLFSAGLACIQNTQFKCGLSIYIVTHICVLCCGGFVIVWAEVAFFFSRGASGYNVAANLFGLEVRTAQLMGRERYDLSKRVICLKMGVMLSNVVYYA